jgi:hypothetical protein
MSELRTVLIEAQKERDAYRLLTSIALEELHATTVKLKRTQESLYAVLEAQRQ